ncbi:glyoxalase/bleomycin resistance/extradiol dioxygenase family protein [Flavobacterium sp. 17A]|uniref:Glyoxalase/bleomycin resistance/extradiol dioxygenase family protein n=1 Tax=Flavobacterium potami TaxID=2872310 RepID=A0A9X1HCZ9_9FLAO|nr:VOC family protein [Flavobacterium potami]MBZ4036881.1 glyoxalase/bleomycin resistance/extradiol dioxygenase family protein [Flavobacterium potami]
MATNIFLNLAVKDLKRAISFYNELGFPTNPKFTNEQGACIVIDKNIYVMILVEEFYKTFTPKQICDTKTASEVLISISLDSRELVDEMLDKAVKAGGTDYIPAKDYGWMYQRTFLDLDGHHWEVFFMDESQIPSEMPTEM